MKYFLHDTSSFDDEKITELWLQFGYEGLGIFYTALEKIGRQEKPIKTEILKSQLKIGKRLNKCWTFIEQIGLISSSDGESFSKQLLNFSETYKIKKEKTRIKVLEWRKKQEDIKNVTGYEGYSNPPKVKESKVKGSKEIMYRQFKHLKISMYEIDKLKEAKFSIEKINDILDKIENYKKNNNYSSLYLTALNWLKDDAKKNPVKKLEMEY